MLMDKTMARNDVSDEMLFSAPSPRAIARGIFASKQELKDRLLNFIDYFNRTFARPFRWTYTGRPVKAKQQPRPRTWRENWAKTREAGQSLVLVT